MIHQPFGGITGSAEDIARQANEILKLKEELLKIMVELTGQDPIKLREDSERDHFMGPEEAIAYGIADKVVTSSKG